MTKNREVRARISIFESAPGFELIGPGLMEAASGFEPLHRGFADLSLGHLGTPPLFRSVITSEPSLPLLSRTVTCFA
jgi:hypothetical protein